MKEMKCQLCHEKLHSEPGKVCKLCGMVLEDESREFCSKVCRIKYDNVKR